MILVRQSASDVAPNFCQPLCSQSDAVSGVLALGEAWPMLPPPLLLPAVAFVSVDPDPVDGLAPGVEELEPEVADGPDGEPPGLDDAPGLDALPPPAPDDDCANVTTGIPTRSTARARITTRCTCFICISSTRLRRVSGDVADAMPLKRASMSLARRLLTTQAMEEHPPPVPEQLKHGEEVIDRSRNLRHLVALQRVLNVLRLRRSAQSPEPDPPPPPLSH